MSCLRPNSLALKCHSPVSPDPLNARSLRSLVFPKSPPLKDPRSANAVLPQTDRATRYVSRSLLNCCTHNCTNKLYNKSTRNRSNAVRALRLTDMCVCPVIRPGLLLSAVPAGDIDRQRRPAERPAAAAPQHGARQQMRAVSRCQLSCTELFYVV